MNNLSSCIVQSCVKETRCSSARQMFYIRTKYIILLDYKEEGSNWERKCSDIYDRQNFKNGLLFKRLVQFSREYVSPD
jgi:hypothetical protein